LNKIKNKLKKIRTEDLSLGMFVYDVGRKWFDHPWTKQKKLITSKKEIEQLKEYGIDEVTIDLARGSSPKKIVKEIEKLRGISEKAEQIAEPVEEKPGEPVKTVPLEEELPRARETYFSALQTTREFLADARAGREVNVPKVQANVEDIIDSTFRNRDASLALIKLKAYDEYTLTHSLNVAVLSICIGCHVNFSRQKIRELGLGAILHDLGKTKVPYNILNKRTSLTEKEFRAIKSHTVIGANMLEKTKKIPGNAVSIARHHHERIDGSGYPDHLTEDQIDEFITIAGLADVYDALTSDRVYRKSIPPHEALKTIFALRGKQFDTLWVEKFTQCLGIYPAGTLVKLNTGEIAVVRSVNRSTLLRPNIRLILDPKGVPIFGVKTMNLDAAKFLDINIVGVIDPRTLGLDLSIYF